METIHTKLTLEDENAIACLLDQDDNDDYDDPYCMDETEASLVILANEMDNEMVRDADKTYVVNHVFDELGESMANSRAQEVASTTAREKSRLQQQEENADHEAPFLPVSVEGLELCIDAIESNIVDARRCLPMFKTVLMLANELGYQEDIEDAEKKLDELETEISSWTSKLERYKEARAGNLKHTDDHIKKALKHNARCISTAHQNLIEMNRIIDARKRVPRKGITTSTSEKQLKMKNEGDIHRANTEIVSMEKALLKDEALVSNVYDKKGYIISKGWRGWC